MSTTAASNQSKDSSLGSNNSNQRPSNRRNSNNNNNNNNNNDNNKWVHRNSNGNTNNNANNSNGSNNFTRQGVPPAAFEQHSRVLFVLANLVGAPTEVVATDGSIYNGVFSSATTGKDVNLKLKVTRRRRFLGDSIGTGVRNLQIDSREITSFSAQNINTQSVSVKLNTNKNNFETDTAISGKTNLTERTLQKWGESDETVAASALESSSNGTWDQFAVNEKLFGVTTDFQEELYTTKLDTSSKDYEKRLKLAEKLAKEIEQGPTDNVHLAEERNIKPLSDSKDEMNEEDKYSSVIRAPDKYIPPSARRQQEQSGTGKPESKEKTKTLASVVAGNLNDKAKETKTQESNVTEPKTIDNKSTGVTAASTLAQIVKRRGQQVPEGFKPVDINKVSQDFKEYSQNEKSALLEKKQELLSPEKKDIIVEFKNFSQQLSQKLPALKKDEGKIENENKKTEIEKVETKTDLSKEEDKEKNVTEEVTKEEESDANKDDFKFNVEADEFVPGGDFRSVSNSSQGQQNKRRVSSGMPNFKYNKYNKGMNKHHMGNMMGGQFQHQMGYSPYGYVYPAQDENGYPIPPPYYPTAMSAASYASMPYPQGATMSPFIPMMMPPYTGVPGSAPQTAGMTPVSVEELIPGTSENASNSDNLEFDQSEKEVDA